MKKTSFNELPLKAEFGFGNRCTGLSKTGANTYKETAYSKLYVTRAPWMPCNIKAGVSI